MSSDASAQPAPETPAAPAPESPRPDDDAAVVTSAAPATPKVAKLPRPKTMDEYIERLEDWRGDAVARLRALVREVAPEATEAIKWAQPVFEQNGPFCYIKAFARRVNIGFWRGAELADPASLLKGVGTRMKHIKVTGPDDIPDDAIRAFAAEAVALNDQRGDPTRNR